jgi:XTP/dITP diphosphohydrolase
LSARYGGEEATWPERRQALLRETSESGDPDRSARFVCVLHYHAGDGCEYAGRGEVEGLLACEERGSRGFSYDPIFEFPSAGRTFAELSEQEKNAVSHRAWAAQALLDAVRAGQHLVSNRISSDGT